VTNPALLFTFPGKTMRALAAAMSYPLATTTPERAEASWLHYRPGPNGEPVLCALGILYTIALECGYELHGLKDGEEPVGFVIERLP